MLADKTALGPHGHNHSVFHLLGFYQAQHFGAEVFPAVRPAQAASGHLAPAQVYPFHPGGIYKDFKFWQRQRHITDRLRSQLEGHIFLVIAIRRRLIEVGAQGRFNHFHITANNAVVIQIGHLVQLFHQLLVQSLQFFLAAFE